MFRVSPHSLVHGTGRGKPIIGQERYYVRVGPFPNGAHRDWGRHVLGCHPHPSPQAANGWDSDHWGPGQLG